MTKPICAGLIGYGGSGKYFHAPFLASHPGFYLKSVVERSNKEAEKTYPGIVSHPEVDWLLADPEIELVVISSPNSTHFPLACKSLQAGKHVVIEKPFTSNTLEASELIKLSREKKLFLGVYQNRRLEGDFLTLQKILREGLLGEIVEFESHFDRYRPGFNVKAWKEIKSPGTGLVFDLGSHLIDQALVLFGLPDFVSATIRSNRAHAKVDDYFCIRLQYPSTEVFLRSSIFVKNQSPRFSLHGKKGSFIKYGIDPQEDLLKLGIMPKSPDWAPDAKENWGELSINLHGIELICRVPTQTATYMAFYESVYERLRNNKVFPIPAEQAYHTIRVIELAYESSAQKRSLPYSGLPAFNQAFNPGFIPGDGA